MVALSFRRRLAVELIEERLLPAQLMVMSATDDQAPGTLRSVIATADANGEADTITFNPSITSINMQFGQLLISEGQNLLIDGGGHVTINGTPTWDINTRIFCITAPNQPTITIKSITLANATSSSGSFGIGGAAILARDQSLNLIECKFFNNIAWGGGAIQVGQGSQLRIEESIFQNNRPGLVMVVPFGLRSQSTCQSRIPHSPETPPIGKAARSVWNNLVQLSLME